MQDRVKAPPVPKRVPSNKGKLTGAKRPLRPRFWSIRTKFQIEGRTRDLAMLNLAMWRSRPQHQQANIALFGLI
jgi:hypothetical protein